MFKERLFNILLFCVLITVCTAILQYIYPGLSFLLGGLVIAILLTVFLKKDIYSKFFGGIGILLIILASIFLHEEVSSQILLIKTLFASAIVLATTVTVLYLKRLYGSIESDQQQVKALFEYTTEGIILTNQKGVIVLVNPAALNLFCYDREELVGKPIETLIPMRFHHRHEKDREGFYHRPSNRTMGHGRDLFAKKRDGKEFPVEVSLSYYQLKNEFFVIAFIVDITQRKEAEKRTIEQKDQLEKVTEDIRRLNAELENKVEERTMILKEALQELEKSQQHLSEALDKEKELNEIKSRFVSMASHEFRTPLSTVLSSAALISKYPNTEEQDKRERHIKRIKDAVKHLNDLLEDFLSLGKLEEGKVQMRQELIPIQEFLEDVVEEMKTITKDGQQIQIDIQGTNEFYSDKKLVRNILINLLGNAVKFSTEQSTIYIKAIFGQNELQIAVQDEGIGISEEDQQHLFTSFFRGKNVVNIQGTGLGLHIVKRYVELLKGNIQLNSILGKGTTILVNLPSLPNE